MKKIILFAVCFSWLFCTIDTFAKQEYFRTVKISGRKNCAIFSSKKWQKKSAKIDLPPGRYVFKPIGGAISPWPKDKIAMECCGEKPWMWYLLIDIDGKKYVMGRLVKFDSPQEAFVENEDDEIAIELIEQKTIKIGTEDLSEGKDYCNDNRGYQTIGIIKIK